MYLGAFCITPGINGNVICFSLEKAAIFPYDVSFNARGCFLPQLVLIICRPGGARLLKLPTT